MIDEITRLVMLELENASGSPTGFTNNKIKITVLIDPEVDNLDAIFDVLVKKAPEKYFYNFVTTDGLDPLVKKTVAGLDHTITANTCRAGYKKIAGNSDQILAPFVSVTGLTKTANLIGDEPLPGIALQGLLQGKPVTFCTDYLHSLHFTDSSPSKRLFALIRSNLTTLEEMGVNLTQLESLKENILEKKEPQVTAKVGLKHVVTNDDIQVAANQKIKVLSFPRGTIITPLARDTANTLGLEIKIV